MRFCAGGDEFLLSEAALVKHWHTVSGSQRAEALHAGLRAAVRTYQSYKDAEKRKQLRYQKEVRGGGVGMGGGMSCVALWVRLRTFECVSSLALPSQDEEAEQKRRAQEAEMRKRLEDERNRQRAEEAMKLIMQDEHLTKQQQEDDEVGRVVSQHASSRSD